MVIRRDFMMLAIAGCSVTINNALAQSVAGDAGYPARPIRFVAGFPPGGVADIVARAIVPPLSSRLGQPVIIDNKSGAGGVIGVDTIAKSPADGYTMGFGVSGALTSSVTLLPKLPYDPTRDIAPISTVVSNPLVLVVPSSSGIKNLKEFVAAAKAAKGKVSYGTAGTGTAMNLSGELLKLAGGFDMIHVPYKGSSPATTDLLGGHLFAAVVDLATAKPHLASGRLRAMGVTSAKRTALAPDIPTIAEGGLPGYEFNSWFGLIMPAATPAAILARVHAELTGVLNDPTVRRQLMDAGVEPFPGTQQAMSAQIKKEIAETAKLIKDAGIVVD